MTDKKDQSGGEQQTTGSEEPGSGAKPTKMAQIVFDHHREVVQMEFLYCLDEISFDSLAAERLLKEIKSAHEDTLILPPGPPETQCKETKPADEDEEIMIPSSPETEQK